MILPPLCAHDQTHAVQQLLPVIEAREKATFNERLLVPQP